MRHIRPMSLRARLTLLVLLAIVPVAALLIFTNLEERERAVADARTDALTRVQFLKVDLEQRVESARQLLAALAQLREVRAGDPAACAAHLAELNRLNPGYLGFGVARPDGAVLCSTLPWSRTADVSQVQYAWFQRAKDTRAFAMGDYQGDPSAGSPVLTFSYPVLDARNEVQGVVFTEMRLTTLSQLASETQYPELADLIAIDRLGTILDRHPQRPQWVGRALPEAPLIHVVLAQHQGVVEVAGVDGVSRLYAFAPVGGVVDTGLYVSAGIPTDVVFAEANQTLLRSLLALGVIAALALVTAFFFANTLILRHVKGLVGATQQLRQGNLSARSTAVSQTAELDALASAFNEMAAALEHREAQRRRAEDRLREQRELLRVTLSSIGDAVVATDALGTVAFMNPVAEDLTGWPQTEAVGQPVETLLTFIDEDTRQANDNPVLRVLQGGAIVEMTNHTLLVTRQGREIPVDHSGAPILSAKGELVGVVLVFRDVAERRHAERRLLLQYTVARLLAESDPLEEPVAKVLQAICEGIGWQVGTLWCVDRGARVLRWQTAWQSPDLDRVDFQTAERDALLRPGIDLPGRAWADGHTLWLPDIGRDALFLRAEAASAAGLRAAVALPIRSGSEVIGVLECLSDRCQKPDEELLTLLEALASQLGNFVERVEAEEALYETSRILQAVFEGTTDSIYVKDRAGRYLLANSATGLAAGVPLQHILGRDDTDLFPPETARIIMEEDRQVMAEGQARMLENVMPLQAAWRVYHAVKAPYRDLHGKVIGLIGIARDVTDLKQAEMAQRLLAETGRLLTASLDDETCLANVTSILVPDLADWCAIDVVEGEQAVRRLAAAHVDPSKSLLAEDLYRRHPPDWNAPVGLPKVLRTGQSEFLPDATDALLQASIDKSQQFRILRELGLRSVMIVPLNAHSRTLGAITLMMSDSDRRYTAADLALAEDVARRCALALDNARLYRAESTTRAEAEAAQQRLAFLAEASRALMTATDVDARLASLSRYVVPTLADWCAVYLVEPDASVRLAAAAHRDPRQLPRLQSSARQILSAPAANSGVARVLRTGLPEISSRVPDDLHTEPPEDGGDQGRLDASGLNSRMIVPLKARGRTVGALTLASANPGRPYTRSDLTLVEQLAAYAALAVDSARLYQDAQQLNARLDQRVKERTALLQANYEKLQEQIAERQRTEAELAEVQRQLAKGRESERLHLAQELHDGPVQDLYGIAYRLAGLRDAPNDKASAVQLSAAQSELRQVVHTLRNVSSRLRPPTLAPFGLEIAIRSHAEHFGLAHPELDIHLELAPDRQQLPEAARLALYRIYQQMLSNVARHAQARHVTVRMSTNLSEAGLEIQDDGCGFHVPQRRIDLARQGHLGLIGAVERAEALGGTFQVKSAPGVGTWVGVRIPLAARAPDGAFSPGSHS